MVIRLTRRLTLLAAVAILGLRLVVPGAAAGQSCATDADCGPSAACIGGTCCTPSDISNLCGGDCGSKCADAGVCNRNRDCQSGSCKHGTCMAAEQTRKHRARKEVAR
jgi:hypothetical protein